MILARHDRAISIACEHIRWCQSQGISPGLVIGSLGGHSEDGNTWDDAVHFVARRWFELDLMGEAC